MRTCSETYMLERVCDLENEGKINFGSSYLEEFMSYDGTVGDVLDRLKNSFSGNPLESTLDLFLHSTRLLIGIIDYSLEKDADLLDAKHSAEDFCYHIYRGEFEISRDILSSLELSEDIAYYPVNEKPDPISWFSFEPNITSSLIYKLEENDIGFDHIFLDGHDAYRPGFFVSAYFKKPVCCVRNSLDSGRDLKARPIKGEIEYLRENLFGKKALLLGEDVSTGNALDSLERFAINICHLENAVRASCLFISDDSYDPPDFFGEEISSIPYTYPAIH